MGERIYAFQAAAYAQHILYQYYWKQNFIQTYMSAVNTGQCELLLKAKHYLANDCN